MMSRPRTARPRAGRSATGQNAAEQAAPPGSGSAANRLQALRPKGQLFMIVQRLE